MTGEITTGATQAESKFRSRYTKATRTAAKREQERLRTVQRTLNINEAVQDVELTIEKARRILESQGVLRALDDIVEENNEGRPSSQAVSDFGYIKSDDGLIHAVAVIRWDPEVRNVPKVGRKTVSKAVRVVCTGTVTDQGVNSIIEGVDVAKQEQAIKGESDRKVLVWKRYRFSNALCRDPQSFKTGGECMPGTKSSFA